MDHVYLPQTHLLPSPPSAPQQLAGKATIEQESTPIVSKDTQSGAAATSRIIYRTPTPTSPHSENIKRLQGKTSSALTCCLLDKNNKLAQDISRH
ncbi:hypothetical protein OSB04_011852 [Centaurea solstitialis]|uniref:Uncharacterized protein n=1 Tax=Centaurea solstitialis TaxID=347529 RepID=A0AA38THT7_9ASTR|nr:hypothetical protein OSB04_011852 [Centaurea solstitialis]